MSSIREIYHCCFCNLCQIGKGLGIDYFHCMDCNACMPKSLMVHACREKCFESNCPICHDGIFTSSTPVKALSCGHLMHSACFQGAHYVYMICRSTLVLAIPGRYVASHWETCRFMKKQLKHASKLKRKRKSLPLTKLDIWKSDKSLQMEQIF